MVESLLLGSLERKYGSVKRSGLTAEALRKSVLLSLAEEIGQELSRRRGGALRRSLELEPDPSQLRKAAFQQPHLRGEVLVAAMLTADRQVAPADQRFGFRRILRAAFRSWGIVPASGEADRLDKGLWEPPEGNLQYEHVHLQSLERDRDEVFRFVWENRKKLCLYEDAYNRVTSVRPCVRVGPDGFILRETVAEYLQMIDLQARELGRFGLRAPRHMPCGVTVRLYGGGALIFDEFGQLKFHVRKRIDNRARRPPLRRLAQATPGEPPGCSGSPRTSGRNAAGAWTPWWPPIGARTTSPASPPRTATRAAT